MKSPTFEHKKGRALGRGIQVLEIYHLQKLYDCLAESSAALQPVAKPDLPCGVMAACFQLCLTESKFVLIDARVASGALTKQVSSFSMYSSHSATPIFSPVLATSPVFGDSEVFAGLLLLLLPPQLAVNPKVPQIKAASKIAFWFNLINVCLLKYKKLARIFSASQAI